MPFHWHDDHLAAELPHGARALFSTRRGGVSTGPFASLNLGRTTAEGDGDDPAAIAENRTRLAAAAGVAELNLTRQVHATAIATDDAALDEADGRVTARAGMAATVLVADCLPVAIAGPGAVAMLHAGWRGLAGGILRRGAELVRAHGDGELHAAIGPGIGVCCFEVGDEVREAFAEHAGARRGRNLDLKRIARRELLDAGVSVVDDCELCTMCEPELFFSHRRDGAATGRQAGVAWRS
ncbi:MAG TPA: polyphenol oxidase family protein [Capillimicrobium sp.]|nr:polyphenol oxidase family protein [Capillimicrobium sp.]